MTQGKMRIARCMTGSGVWMKMAAQVPTTTIMKAAADSSAMSPAPLSTAPTRMAFSASTNPMMLSMSNGSPYIPRPDSNASTSVWPEAMSPLLTPGTAGPCRACVVAQVSRAPRTSPDRRARLASAASSSVDQLHDAADDLAGEILVALRKQDVGEVSRISSELERAVGRNFSTDFNSSIDCTTESSCSSRGARVVCSTPPSVLAASCAVRSASGPDCSTRSACGGPPRRSC